MPTTVAIVTGANKGLGYAVVKQLCQEYTGKVYLTSRDIKRGTEACENFKKSGLNPTFHQLDISDKNSIEIFIKNLENNNEIVDILVNNAGVLLVDPNESKLYQAEQMMNINFNSLVNFTELLLPFMIEGSRIVNVSSSSGHLSRIPSDDLKKKFLEVTSLEELKKIMDSYLDDVRNGEDIGWGNNSYVVTKVGVNCYTFLLHKRSSPKGISVTTVHPGYVITDMTAGRGNVSPEDAAKLVADLALRPPSSGQYVWSNGSVVDWDGPDPRGFIDGRKL